MPIAPDLPDKVRNASVTLLGHRGIELDVEKQLGRLSSWTADRHQKLFAELRTDPLIRVTSNGFFMTPDAEIYASMIMDRKPRRVIEVGSGYSTLIARNTIRYAGYPTKLTASSFRLYRPA